jgi:hypothetical protein
MLRPVLACVDGSRITQDNTCSQPEHTTTTNTRYSLRPQRLHLQFFPTATNTVDTTNCRPPHAVNPRLLLRFSSTLCSSRGALSHLNHVNVPPRTPPTSLCLLCVGAVSVYRRHFIPSLQLLSDRYLVLVSSARTVLLYCARV